MLSSDLAGTVATTTRTGPRRSARLAFAKRLSTTPAAGCCLLLQLRFMGFQWHTGEAKRWRALAKWAREEESQKDKE
jgi:hypothetical protein